MGAPAEGHVTTSCAERQTFTMRMDVRRLIRMTNRFGKEIENHKHAMALYFMYYNFYRKHERLTKAVGGIHTTSPIAAGVSDYVWKVAEIVALVG